MINKIPEQPVVSEEPQRQYELTVRDLKTGEIIYQDTGYGGVMCFMEEIKSMKVVNNELEIEGNHQHMIWGHPFVSVYCMDHLGKYFDKFLPVVMEELKRKGIKL